ncbi:MAG TPA: secretin and TonB N-terminal domain-containing protein [Nitrosomonas halophila]|nr:secretin and TonB N-terminal domain-containing protein [Nitrosomonas halophila]
MTIGKYISMLLMFALLASCATYTTRNPAFMEGKQLIAEGKLEAGLDKLEQAAQEEPENVEIRTVLSRERDAILGQILFEGDNARTAGDFEGAEQHYQRALQIHPRSERARVGLSGIDQDRGHSMLIKQAKELLAHDDLEGAEKIVRHVLAENPVQVEARLFIKQLSERIARAESSELALISEFSKPITMEFRDTPLKTVFELISRTAGINFVFDRNVQQEAKTSIFVRNNPIEDVLKLLLMTNQLAYKVLNDNSMLIYPDTPAKHKDYQELVIRSFHIANTDAKQMVAMIRGLVKARDIYVNERLNLFVIRDTLEMVRLVERLVAINDFPDPEVMLDVEILEINRNTLLNLGPNVPDRVGFSAVPGVPAVLDRGGVNSAQFNQLGFDGLKSFTVNSQMVIDLRKVLTVNDILANPRIRVKSREKAKILIGDRIPVITSNVTGVAATVSQSVTFVEVGLKLDVEPIISQNDEVSIKVSLEVSNVTDTINLDNGGQVPVVGTRTAETLLSSKNGETQILAGLIQDRDRKGFTGLPGLIDIPVLGRLFSNQNLNREKTEIVLLVTPRIVRNIIQPNHFESEFHSGTASTAGRMPVKIRKTAPQSLAMAAAGPVRGGPTLFEQAVQSAGLGDASDPALNPFAAAAAQARAATPSVTLMAPANVAMGREFTATVRLVTQNTMLTGEMDLTYDQDMLELMDGGEKSGSRNLKLGREQPTGMTTVLRFKAISANPGATEISLQNLQVQDEKGQPVETELPSAVNVEIQ